MIADDLVIYIEELSEIAKYSQVQVAIMNEIKGSIAIRYAILFYDFFYSVVDFAIQMDCPYMIEHFEDKEECLIMRLLPSEDIGVFKAEPRLIAAIAAVKGDIVTKELEDTIGISISFPKGGVAYD